MKCSLSNLADLFGNAEVAGQWAVVWWGAVLPLAESAPQGLKPDWFWAVFGTTEVGPFQNMHDHLCGGHP